MESLVRELGSYIATIEAMNSLRHSREALLVSGDPKSDDVKESIKWLSATWRDYAGQLQKRTSEIDKILIKP